MSIATTRTSTITATTTSTSTTQFFQDVIIEFHTRKLLLHATMHHPPPPNDNNTTHDQTQLNDNTFDANVVMVLSVLLCALICALGLNSIIRCAIRCSNLVSSDANNNNSNGTNSARLANTGVKKKALKTFHTINYSPDSKLPGLATECVICLSEFTPGERVRLLPKCNHGFHVKCIDHWLRSHSSCPTCRHCLIETCQKIVGCSQQQQQASTSTPPPRVQETIVTIPPLQREGLISNRWP